MSEVCKFIGDRKTEHKASELKDSTNKVEQPNKKRRVAIEDDRDKIDPVEKLLSLNKVDGEILNQEELPQEEAPPSNNDKSNVRKQVSLNFTGIYNETLKSYYSKLRKSPMEFYSDNSTFSMLNKQPENNSNNNTPKEETPAPQVLEAAPFFKNVNFNSNSSSRPQTFEDFFAYDDLTDSDGSEDDKAPETPPSIHISTGPKMCFRYRQNDNLNLSLSPLSSEPLDIGKFLNRHSLLSGKASEMVSSGNFLIHDFFL